MSQFLVQIGIMLSFFKVFYMTELKCVLQPNECGMYYTNVFVKVWNGMNSTC